MTVKQRKSEPTVTFDKMSIELCKCSGQTYNYKYNKEMYVIPETMRPRLDIFTPLDVQL